ncbi:glycosyltransferase 87 family protein [Streptomyces sp. NPDC091268]|uniref:glycosyltransferase 87 family protein n=1 Tax=Streptomyces sp. NPDC091268 TaxID=3365979 RepID=UPI00381529D6
MTTNSLSTDPVGTAPRADLRTGRGPVGSALRGRGGYLAMAGFWLVTRVLMLVLPVKDFHGTTFVGTKFVGAEIQVYRNWYDVLVTGTMPHNDVMWQYPPGAAGVFLSPDLLPFLGYTQAWIVLTAACDALVAIGLVRAARRSDGSMTGAVLWLAALPLMLSMPFSKIDLHVTLLAVGSLLCLRLRPKLGGVLAGAGAMIKVWPLLTLIGTPRGKSTRDAIVSAVVACAALLAVFALFFRDTLGFLGNQGNRGIQIESLGGSALMVAKYLDLWHGKIDFQYGAFEYVGPYVSSVARLSLLLTAVGFLGLLVWRVKSKRWTAATPLDAALCAVLVFTVTSRVLSPQYLIWLLGIAAVCLTSRHTTQRPIALLIAVSAGLSTVIFPLAYGTDVLVGTGFGTFLLCTRNALLAVAAVWSGVRLWKATVTPGPEPELEAGGRAKVPSGV